MLPLILFILILIGSIVVMFKNEILIPIASVLFGFALFGLIIVCTETKVSILPTKYEDPDSVFNDNKYIVCVLDSKTYLEDKALEVSQYTDDKIVKIVTGKYKNSYYYTMSEEPKMKIFTKEEWTKIQTSGIEIVK